MTTMPTSVRRPMEEKFTQVLLLTNQLKLTQEQKVFVPGVATECAWLIHIQIPENSTPMSDQF
jgi:hypothetical protein